MLTHQLFLFIVPMHEKGGIILRKILKFYDLLWGMAIPLLRLNPRLGEGYLQRTLEQPVLARSKIWIQAASAGESYLAREIILKLRANQPIDMTITTNTSQGMQILNEAIAAVQSNNVTARAAYFPFDRPSIMDRAVKIVRPRLAVLLETEIWPGFLHALKKSGSKIIIINGRLSAGSLKNYMIRPSIWKELAPDKILAISHEDADRFKTLFGDRVEIMPNMKFDRTTITGNTGNDSLERIIHPDKSFLVIGSTHQDEEPFIEKIICRILALRPETVIGLFPRHMHRIEYWKKTLPRIGVPFVLRSETGSYASSGTVILWDTFGELSGAYEHAGAAFVGGSLVPEGGQNFLEALACGVTPVIGPHWETFAWIGREIMDCNLVFIANDWMETADLLVKHLENPLPREKVRERAVMYVKQRRGGTKQACRTITGMLDQRERISSVAFSE